MTARKHEPPPVVHVSLSWDLGIPHHVTTRRHTNAAPELGPFRYVLCDEEDDPRVTVQVMRNALRRAVTALESIRGMDKATAHNQASHRASVGLGQVLNQLDVEGAARESTKDMTHSIRSILAGKGPA